MKVCLCRKVRWLVNGSRTRRANDVKEVDMVEGRGAPSCLTHWHSWDTSSFIPCCLPLHLLGYILGAGWGDWTQCLPTAAHATFFCSPSMNHPEVVRPYSVLCDSPWLSRVGMGRLEAPNMTPKATPTQLLCCPCANLAVLTGPENRYLGLCTRGQGEIL